MCVPLYKQFITHIPSEMIVLKFLQKPQTVMHHCGVKSVGNLVNYLLIF